MANTVHFNPFWEDKTRMERNHRYTTVEAGFQAVKYTCFVTYSGRFPRPPREASPS